MSPSTYVLLDTNILFRIITQGQVGCELEHLRELVRHIDDGDVSLLVPEIVLLELEKQYRGFENTVSVNLAKLEKHLSGHAGNEKLWNELGDIVSYLAEKLEDWKREKVEGAKRRHDEVQSLVRLERAVELSFDNEIWLRAKRRIWAGRVANPDGRSEADCCILESLLKFFESHDATGQLLFCTENLKDFCLQLEDEKRVMHPLMREGLPPTEIFKDLASLVAFLRQRKAVEEPSREEVNEALDRERERQVEEEAARESLDDLLRLRAMEMRTRDFGVDVPAYYDLVAKMRALAPDSAAIRAMEMKTRDLGVDVPAYHDMVAKMRALAPDSAAIRAMEMRTRDFGVDVPAYYDLVAKMKALAPDSAAPESTGQEIANLQAQSEQTTPAESDANGNPAGQSSTDS